MLRTRFFSFVTLKGGIQKNQNQSKSIRKKQRRKEKKKKKWKEQVPRKRSKLFEIFSFSRYFQIGRSRVQVFDVHWVCTARKLKNWTIPSKISVENLR
jgi:hypothetical protein